MLERLVSLLKGELKAEGSERGPFERRMIAVAALLLEAMHVDHVDSPAEQQREAAAARALQPARRGG